jgi:hypothetical protein
VVAFLCAPAADARPEAIELRLPATDGYRFELSVNPESGGGGYSSVSFSKDHGSVLYSGGRGVFGDRRITADFGPLGRVAVRYEVKGPPVRGNCVVPRWRPVRLVGSVDIQGENGFTSVSSRAARGRAWILPDRCRRSASRTPAFHETEDPPDIDLEACHRQPGRAITYGAVAGYPFLGENALHSALAEERLGRLYVIRSVDILAPPGTLRAKRRAGTATLTPTGRFSGSATFANGRLSGDLAVLFPGIEAPVPIAPAKGDLAFRDFAEGCRVY